MNLITERKGDYLLTFTGQEFWPLDPRAEEVDIRDIAHSLALQCRFTGHTRSFYSVAEHSVRVSLEVQRQSPPQGRTALSLLGLIHGAAEAYLHDLPKPLKRCEQFGEYHHLEDVLLDAICEKFSIPTCPTHIVSDFWYQISHIDKVLLATEFRDLMPAGNTDQSLAGIEPLSEVIRPWDWTMAEAMFLERFRELTQ